MQVSISALARMTKKDRRTVTRRLEDLPPDAAGEYACHEALARIYDADALNPAMERAKLDRVRTEIAEIQKAERLRELIPADAVRASWERMTANARAKLLNLPGRLAVVAVGVATIQEAERAARELIHEALSELSRGEDHGQAH